MTPESLADGGSVPVIPPRHSQGSPAANRVGLLFSGLAMLLGLGGMAGWLLHMPALIQILPGQSPMMFNSAIGLVVAAAGLQGFARGSHVSTICGALLLLVGGLTACEFIATRDLGIDQLLVSDWHGGATPGRMGFNTALCLVALGMAFVLERTHRTLSSHLTLPAAIVVLSVSGAALIGYATGLEDSYAWGGTTRMALHSATGLNLLGLGLLLLGWRRTNGARQIWIVVGAGASVAGIALVISMGIVSAQSRSAEAGKRRDAAEVARLTALGVDQLIGDLERLDGRWAHDCGPACERDITAYLRDYPELIRLGWVEPGTGRVDLFRRADAGGIQHESRDLAVTLARFAGSSAGQAMTVVPDPAAAYELLVTSRSDAAGVRFIGTVDGAALLRRTLRGHDLEEAVGLEIGSQRVVHLTQAPAGEGDDAATSAIRIAGTMWQFRVRGPEAVRSRLADVVLIVGMLVACFVATSVFFWTKSRARLLKIDDLNADLRSRILELASTRAELQRVLDAATQVSIIATDARGTIRLFNAGAERMFGYRSDEMVGIQTPEILHDPVECAERSAQLSADVGRPVEGFGIFVEYANEHPFDERAWAYIRKDGSRLDGNLIITPVRTDAGVIDGYLGIATDITARTRLEAELKHKNETLAEETRRAEAANRAKSEFLATMSHEIRTPLNGVVGMAELLMMTDLSIEQQEYADIVVRSADSLLTIINDILDFSKIESGKIELESIDFVLRTAIEEATELLAERGQSKGLEMATLIHPAIPAMVRGDPARVRQILTNLLGNAIKFTEVGEIVLRASLSEESASTVTIRFEITDTGIGISPEGEGRLFQSFSQADSSTTRRFGGTGLGLVIAKRLVEVMGGEIGVDSELGKGSTFWFTVTMLKIPAGEIALPVPRDDLRGVYALAVDDNETNLQLVRAQTRAWDMLCDIAPSAPVALTMMAAAARIRPYDVALLDMQMPDMDGLDLARAIKADPAHVHVRLVLMTSMAQRGHAAQSALAGFDAYLHKPLRQAQLYECLRTVMGLPTLAPRRGPATPAAMVTAHTLKEAHSRQRTRVLLAEDNQTNQMTATRMLEKLGYQVDVAVEGLEALEACRRGRYAIILMDVQMPGMDGLAAAREIRLIERAGGEPRALIIALTADAMRGDRERCLAAGMDDYLAKPFKIAQLREMLERWTPRVASTP